MFDFKSHNAGSDDQVAISGMRGVSPGLSDKRRQPRKSLNLVLAKVSTAGGDGVICRVRNLSACGLMIERESGLHLGERVNVGFPDLALKGSIVWSSGDFRGVETDEPFCPHEATNKFALSWERVAWEHAYLSQLAETLRVATSSPAPIDSIRCHKVRQKFSQALRAHLKHEDWIIYPRLLTDCDPIVVAAASRLQNDHGDLERLLSEYTRTWITTTIEGHWPQFCSETGKFLSAVKSRVSREDAELYATLSPRK